MERGPHRAMCAREHAHARKRGYVMVRADPNKCAASRGWTEIHTHTNREWTEDGQLWVQYVSSTPATRLDVINLQVRVPLSSSSTEDWDV